MLSPTTPRQHVVSILLLGLLFIGTGIGLRDPWPSDEPRFAMIARDMVNSGEWFFPRRGSELYPDKPPLFMWAQAFFYQITGSLRVAFLLPSLASALLTLLLVYDAGRRLWRPRVGLFAALLLLVTPQFVLESRAGQLDAMVTCWIALGCYGFIRHLLLGPDLRWFYIGFAACGLGIITKGVGFLPLLIFLPWLWARRRVPPTSRSHANPWPHALLGPLLMLAVVAIWLLPMLVQVELAADPALVEYRDNILFKQTGQRYVIPSGHLRPPWYFVTNVIPPLWLPVFLLLPWLLPAWKRRIARSDPRFTILLGWALLVIVFFTISPAKRGVYILPALPWVCLAAAPLLGGLIKRAWVRRIGLAAPALVGLSLASVGAYLLWIEPEKNLQIFARFEVNAAPGLLVCGVLLLLITTLLRRWPASAYGGMMLLLWLAYGLWLGPVVNDTKSGRALLVKVEQMLSPDTPLGLVGWREQTRLQALRPTVEFGFLASAEQQALRAIQWLQQNPNGRLLVQGRFLSPCFAIERSRLVGTAHRRHWYLVDRKGVTPTCTGSE